MDLGSVFGDRLTEEVFFSTETVQFVDKLREKMYLVKEPSSAKIELVEDSCCMVNCAACVNSPVPTVAI